MAVHWQFSSEGTSTLVLCQIREVIKRKQRYYVGLFGELLFCWVSNSVTRTATNADSPTFLQGQKEGTGKKKSVMPLASRFRMWLWICNFVQGYFFFQNSMTFAVARSGLPEPSYLFLDLSSEQKLSCNRESESRFTAQVRSQTGGICHVNMETSWWCHSIGAECCNNMDWSQVYKSFHTTSLAHKQFRDWRVSRNLGTGMTFEALCENWAFKNHSN